MLSHSKRIIFLALLGTAHAALQPITTLPAQLSLDDALKIFRERGLDLIIAEAAVASAEGDLRAAAAIANPTFGLTYSHVFTYNPNSNDPGSSCSASNADCTKDGFGLDLNDQGALSDVISGKRSLREKVARAALQAARQNRADAQRTLEFQLKQQYIQAVLARDVLDFSLEVQKATTKTFELGQLRYEKGAISEADEAKIEAAKLEADQAVATAQQALEVAKLGVAVLLGVRGTIPQFAVAQDLPKYLVPPALQSASPESLLAEAIDHRPDLKGQLFQRDRAQAAITLAKRLRVPEIALDLGYQQMGSGGVGTNAPITPPTLSIGLSAPVLLFYQQQGEIKKAEADFKTQNTLRLKLEAQVLNDVAVALANYRATRDLVERMEGRLLDRVGRARDLVALQYQKGAASLLEFLDAQRQWIAINQEYLQDLASYWTAVSQLEAAVGRDLR
jgi:cobalt-zinc-cadmium efflux system outer membrane protein